jgi:phosphoribosylformylglycinamidine cyclo-ligase
VAEQVIAGIALGCRENCCALLGGETAEMPGFYADGEYDLAGFILGIVDRRRILDGARIVPGDVLIGLASAGLHTNGYSLARRVLFDVCRYTPDTCVPELNATVGEALLAPHLSYLKMIQPLLDTGIIKGMAHITGGGITENVPRILPRGCAATIAVGSWMIPPLFQLLQERGRVAADEMFRAFNMGIGLVVVCNEDDAGVALTRLRGSGSTTATIVGRVIAGDRDVRYVT